MQFEAFAAAACAGLGVAEALHQRLKLPLLLALFCLGVGLDHFILVPGIIFPGLVIVYILLPV